MECKKNRKHSRVAILLLSLLSLFGGILCFAISHALYVNTAKSGLGGEPSFLVALLDVCGGTLLVVALLSFIAQAFVRGDR